jgi:tRNA1Val (adenine37-N6)-methyltransferase
MANSYFAFKQFIVYHDKCAMKVGTDGVLLGAWAGVNSAARILDVGTGTGLIAIMLAQRSNAFIDAVEIDEKACIQATENVDACPWKERIAIHHQPFQHFAITAVNGFDLIVSNPPFFRNSLKPRGQTRTLARHDDTLNFESLLFYSSQLLSAAGRLAVIIPAKDMIHFTELAYFQDLHLQLQTLVRPHAGKDYSRCMAEFSRNRNQASLTSELCIKKNDSEEYSDEYRTLTREYYLAMH